MTGCEDLLRNYLDTQQGSFDCRTLSENKIIIVTPHTFADGDRLELMVTLYDDRAVISDFATVAGRLDLVDVRVETQRIRDRIAHIVKGYAVEFLTDELRVHGPITRAGDMMVRLIGAMQQVDALQALKVEPRGPQFARRLISWLREQDREVAVRPTVPGRTGATYRLTALVEAELPIYVQAVTGRTAESDTRSVDHTFRVFSDVNGHLEDRQKLAVLGEDVRAFPLEDVRLLEGVCYVGAWWDLPLLGGFLGGELPESRLLFASASQRRFTELGD